ncbi:MAG: OST-HTH/LOTUS domain-containing protein [Azoarcus sp.]
MTLGLRYAPCRSDTQVTHPWFDPRNYGCQKLGELVRKQPYIEIKEVSAGDGSAIVHLHVRPIA